MEKIRSVSKCDFVAFRWLYLRLQSPIIISFRNRDGVHANGPKNSRVHSTGFWRKIRYDLEKNPGLNAVQVGEKSCIFGEKKSESIF